MALQFLCEALAPGAETVLDEVGLTRHLAGAAWVLTGEGALDAQTLAGKAPAAVCRRARVAGVPVALLVGRSDLTEPQWREAGVAAVVSCGPPSEGSPALRLQAAARRWAEVLSA
jgi:glycerate kinase